MKVVEPYRNANDAVKLFKRKTSQDGGIHTLLQSLLQSFLKYLKNCSFNSILVFTEASQNLPETMCYVGYFVKQY